MKKLLLGICTLAVIVAIASPTVAFDGNRKGFVLGGGLGFSPTATIKSDPVTFNDPFLGPITFQIDESNSGVAVNFVIGYAWDEQNMIVYEGNIVGYSLGSGPSKVDVYQGFNGVSWYHYFGPVGKSGFITGGLGAYVFNVDDQDADMGGALQIGGGYEFARHWQFGAYLGFGKTGDPDFSDIDYKHMHLSIVVGGVAF
jgi:hypothetical protein